MHLLGTYADAVQWLHDAAKRLEVELDATDATVVRRWLERFGPGTEGDIRWWTGWTARIVRAALADIGAVQVDLDGATGYVLADDLDLTPAPRSWGWPARRERPGCRSRS